MNSQGWKIKMSETFYTDTSLHFCQDRLKYSPFHIELNASTSVHFRWPIKWNSLRLYYLLFFFKLSITMWKVDTLSRSRKSQYYYYFLKNIFLFFRFRFITANKENRTRYLGRQHKYYTAINCPDNKPNIAYSATLRISQEDIKGAFFSSSIEITANGLNTYIQNDSIN